ncbi:hypothetical protein ACIG0C_24010 [Kitasatospora aureofaciens]|uniref:Uncharacterized protein n=1 Tax=Kitasatospora aureofaciens TaxID=1894 RepID=A0A1E7N986_KITAU|nr:hypothetical protein [Kitasatospora aureofaciens]OEV37228.1 hypothetical protein HS99_0005345 [Kitasatospora aureofaciens]GGU96073.1 hypothetical protein GCM10010502_57570 [Kitasatospora aureofaciens]
MNKSVGRRAATAAAALAATLGGLLLAGGTASAAPLQAVHHDTTVSVSSAAFQVRDDEGDHSDRFDRYGGGHASRWDGHRSWERQGSYWYSNDHGHRYRYDDHRFYRWDNGWQIIQVINVYGFNPHVFR